MKEEKKKFYQSSLSKVHLFDIDIPGKIRC